MEIFFERLFPELQGCQLYLSGESYAGHFVPFLAKKLLLQKSQSIPPVSGILLGNPSTTHGEGFAFETSDYWPLSSFLYSRGLASPLDYQAAKDSCQWRDDIISYCPPPNSSTNNSIDCLSAIAKAILPFAELTKSNLLDGFNVNAPVCTGRIVN